MLHPRILKCQQKNIRKNENNITNFRSNIFCYNFECKPFCTNGKYEQIYNSYRHSVLSNQFWFVCSAENTEIKIVSGSCDTTLLVGTSWIDVNNYVDTDTMIIYGNVREFTCLHNSTIMELDASHSTDLIDLDCRHNRLTSLNVSGCTSLERLSCYRNRLTSLDISTLTQLNELYLFNNNFTTQALNEIYCDLPQKMPSDYAEIMVTTYATDPIILATNKSNATGKNWTVRYWDGNKISNVPATTGNYVCNNSASLDVIDE